MDCIKSIVALIAVDVPAALLTISCALDTQRRLAFQV